MTIIPLWLHRRWRRTFADLRFLVNRKTSKGTRRGLSLIVLILVLLAIWRDAQQPEEQRYVKAERLTSSALTERLYGNSNTPNKDPRVWTGWNGVKAIFALWVHH